MRTTGILAALAITISALGCGSAETPGAAATSAAAASAPSDPVGRVVYEFLDAVRQGNTATASERLTPLALQRTSELDLNFSPPGSATARFAVGKVEMVDADKAVVESVWTDLDADGKPNQESIVWALKQTEGRWRISGMAATVAADQPPVVIDFENPEAMVQQPAAAPAGQPGGPAADPNAPLPTDKVATDPFQQPTQR